MLGIVALLLYDHFRKSLAILLCQKWLGECDCVITISHMFDILI